MLSENVTVMSCHDDVNVFSSNMLRFHLNNKLIIVSRDLDNYLVHFVDDICV